MELPSHPERTDTTPERQPTRSRDWAGIIVVGVIGSLVLVIVLLHLTGVVGPTAH